MKPPIHTILTLGAALTLGSGFAAVADEKGPAHPKAERKAECSFVRGKKIDGEYRLSDLDGDMHSMKSYLDEADVVVLSFVSLSDLYEPALLEKDEWINEKTQSKLSERLQELKKVMADEQIKAADKSVAYVIVVMTHEGFKPTTIRKGAEGRTLGNVLEVYFEEHGLDKAWIATTPRKECRQAFGLEHDQIATVILEKGRVHYARFSEIKQAEKNQGSGAMADAKRLKKEESEPNPGAMADAKRLKKEESKPNPGARKTAKTKAKKLEELRDLKVALKRIVQGQVSLPASAPRQQAIEQADEARKKAEEQAEQAREEAKESK